MNNTDQSFHIITNGHFSKNGNFVATDSKGNEVHVYKPQMDLLTLKSKEDIVFPIFVIGIIKTFNRLDGDVGDLNRNNIINENGTFSTFQRLTALTVYKSLESFVDAYVMDIALNPDTVYATELHSQLTSGFDEFIQFRIETLAYARK